MLIRIEAPHFVAGIVPGGQCAPILHYMRKWPAYRIINYAYEKGWKVTCH